MKVLVTGITGFIGGHLESLLHSNDFDVSAVVRSKNNSPNDRTQVHLIDDIRTCDFVTITKGFDVVIHLAALVHQPSQLDIDAYMRTNHDVTVALAKACAANKVSKFITLSTSHVYEGLNDDFIESQALSPVSPYAQSKYKATRELDPIFIDTGS